MQPIFKSVQSLCFSAQRPISLNLRLVFFLSID